MEVVASLSQGRTAAAQCGLFTHKSVPVIFEPHCMCTCMYIYIYIYIYIIFQPCKKCFNDILNMNFVTSVSFYLLHLISNNNETSTD